MWQTPSKLPDLRRASLISIDTETKDDRLRADMGSGWPTRTGYLCGISIGWRAEAGIRAIYCPLRHPDSENIEPELIQRWLRDHIAAGVRFVTQNGLYDWGWIYAEFGIRMPPDVQLEEVGALATLIDENRYQYGLDSLCQWRGLPGKDDTQLREGIEALGLHTNKRRKLVPQEHVWQLPARYVGLYAESDAISTLRLFEDLKPVLDQEGTRNAYRLECALLPMVQAMRLRGIRVDLDAAVRARDLLLGKRDAVFTELSDKLGENVSMHEIGRSAWLASTFDRLNIKYPRTAKGNPSFKGGASGWMSRHVLWLPRLITQADKYNNAATKFLQRYVLDYAVNGRIHAEVYPHRSEGNGTKSFRFSYSDPPLQQMSAHDEQISPLIRGVFLPEEGEVWAKPDAKQQEFRFVLHYASQHHLPKAAEWVKRYIEDPDSDFHALTAATTGLERQRAKNTNFAKIYGAGPQKFAEMINQSLAEATEIYNQYDANMPFLRRLSSIYQGQARSRGYIVLYDDARRHFNKFAPGGTWKKGLGPCELAEARERVKDPTHPWYGKELWRVDTYTALNALIQGSAARHTKRWMRAVWREGIVPLLQMHDSLDCSVASPEQAEIVARLCCEVIQLAVPMRCDLKYGKTWGDASHTWDEVANDASTTAAPPSMIASEPQDKCTILGEARLCAHCQLPAGMDAISDQNGGWLHPQCLNAFIDQQTDREGYPRIPWAGGETLACSEEGRIPATEPPPQPLEPPRPDPETAGNARDPTPTPSRRNGGGGGRDNGSVPPGGSKHGPDPDELLDAPFDDTALIRQGYVLRHVYAYTLADGTVLYRQNRYELRPDLTPHKKRPRKRFLPHRSVDGREVLGAGDRQVIYNWPAVMRAGPGATMVVTEGEKNADALIKAGLLATTVLSHKWASECIAALTGCHLIILEDHDEHGRKNAADACAKLKAVAASLRVVPYAHLWNRLDPATRGPEPKAGEDVFDWISKGGNPATLLEICRAIAPAGTDLNIRDASQIKMPPPRGLLLGGQFCRKFLSGLVAPGAVGKTSLRIAQALSLATQRELTGQRVYRRCRVLILSFEDDNEELDRRVLAACLHHNVSPAHLEGWLFLDCPKGLKLAELRKGNRVAGALEPALRRAIERYRPDLVIFDPFIKLHGLEENSNPDMDYVADLLIQIAHEYDIAVDSPAHARKGTPTPGDADIRRGGSAARDAGRLDRTLNVMSVAEAEMFGIEAVDRHNYLRLDSAKVNLLPPAREAQWFCLVSVPLGNSNEDYPEGDQVQTVEPWFPPALWEGLDPDTQNAILDAIEAGMPDGHRYSSEPRATSRAAWAVVQQHCPERTEAQCREIIRTWVKTGMLYAEDYDDPVRRETLKGLRVNAEKRPRQPEESEC
jgi:DNA polymerase I-like protein with 3'-5' exonuclease and polymerase domains